MQLISDRPIAALCKPKLTRFTVHSLNSYLADMVYEPALPRQFSRWASLVEPSDIARWPSLKRRGRSRPPKPKQGCRRQAVAVGVLRKRNKLLKRYIHLCNQRQIINVLILICIWTNNFFFKACFILYTYRWGARVRWLRQIQPIR